MQKVIIISFVVSVLSFVTPAVGTACTSILVTKGASADGSVIVSHEADGELGDARFVYVPATDHRPGSKRAVYPYHLYYPRYVGKDRGPGYDTPGLPESKPLGYIDQVPHTHAYIDAIFGVMNEYQLHIGEVTCGAKMEPEPKAGKRLFYSTELSRVALERCKKADEAIKLMGKLIDDYGYYGTGEALLVGDTEEGWVLEMCGTPDGMPDLWVAKKVPDGEVYVTANEFRIRDVDPDDPDMIVSTNLFSVAKKLGWWKPEHGRLDWLKTVGIGEYNHPYYSLRRVWSVMRRLKPSANFSPWVEDGFTKAYPFSIKADKKLSARDVMALHDDHYEGTEFDMTKGLAAGPYGTPNRFAGPYDAAQNKAGKPQKMWGAWERPVSASYCSYVQISLGRGWLPDPIGGVVWIGLDRPDTTCYVPFYIGVTDLPKSYRNGSPFKFDRKFAWWAFDFVSNWADLKYCYMIKDIRAKRDNIQNREFALQPAIDAGAKKLYETNPRLAREYLTDYCNNNAAQVLREWWALGDELIAKYAQGYVVISNHVTEVGYPEEWLKKTGYANGPVSYQKPGK